jgi:eukaryotic-like serine/threonine-protein kinase
VETPVSDAHASGTGAPAGSRRLVIARDAAGLVLTGVIDESARLGELVPNSPGTLRLDLAGVSFINSLGVREWIRFLANAADAGVTVELARVSEPLIQQLNMIVAARGQAVVLSFYAPYACDACGREDSLLVELAAHRDRLLAGEAPPAVCAECGAAMVFNDFPQRYFLFLGE